MSRTISSQDLAIAIEYSQFSRDLKAKYVTLKGNSRIYQVTDIKVSGQSPDDRPDIDLRFGLYMQDVKTLDIRYFSMAISLDNTYLYAPDQILPTIEARIKEHILLVNPGVVKLLYAKKT